MIHKVLDTSLKKKAGEEAKAWWAKSKPEEMKCAFAFVRLDPVYDARKRKK